jgi:D-alanyl-lipoteichoic acid acyltransferase DltB (MBOAT superfamily)
MVIADNCAVAVNQIWAAYNEETGFVLMVGAILFTFQIYCDFSGYSDIAIGCARLFGFNLMRNFNFPYFSRSIPEFWRRWHISLTTWFRDYIYFPLGGSRCDKWKIIRNVYIVWGISGLWHGANWTFVCWGLFHGTMLAIYNILGISTKYKNVVAYNRFCPSIKELLQMTLTFCIAVIGWVIFRAETINDAFNYLSSMFSYSLLNVTESIEALKGFQLTRTIPALIVMIVCEWIQRDKQHALQLNGNNVVFRYTLTRFALYILLIILTLGLAGTKSEFIYFQF